MGGQLTQLRETGRRGKGRAARARGGPSAACARCRRPRGGARSAGRAGPVTVCGQPLGSAGRAVRSGPRGVGRATGGRIQRAGSGTGPPCRHRRPSGEGRGWRAWTGAAGRSGGRLRNGRVVSAIANWDGCNEWGCASERRRNSDSSRPPLRASRFRTCDRTRVRQRMKFGRTDTDQRRELEVISNEHERVREA